MTDPQPCLICGQPPYRHMEVAGLGQVCPIQSATYRAAPPPQPVTTEQVDRLARRLYAAHCAYNPIGPIEPDWGRGGYKTQVMYWQALARVGLNTDHNPKQDQPEV